MSTKLDEKTLAAIDIVVDTWSQLIMGDTKLDNGEQDFRASMFESMINKNKNISEDQLLVFQTTLRNKITKQMESAMYPYIRTNTDYHPEGILAESFAMAGISDMYAPWKTSVDIVPEGVAVKNGYSASPVIIDVESIPKRERELLTPEQEQIAKRLFEEKHGWDEDLFIKDNQIQCTLSFQDGKTKIFQLATIDASNDEIRIIEHQDNATEYIFGLLEEQQDIEQGEIDTDDIEN